jgi:hypothetical protein
MSFELSTRDHTDLGTPCDGIKGHRYVVVDSFTFPEFRIITSRLVKSLYEAMCPLVLSNSVEERIVIAEFCFKRKENKIK